MLKRDVKPVGAVVSEIKPYFRKGLHDGSPLGISPNTPLTAKNKQFSRKGLLPGIYLFDGMRTDRCFF